MRAQLQTLFITAGFVVAVAGPAGLAQKSETHAPGIYVAKAGGELVRVRGSMPKEVKTKGLLKTMLTQGLAGPSSEVDLAGPAADLRIPEGDTTFYFYFDPNGGQPNPASMDPMQALQSLNMMGGDSMPPTAKSASEFALIRLKITDDARVANMGKPGPNVKPKNTVGVRVERLKEGAYTLQPKDALKPGEYAFCLVTGMGAGGQLWDFGVDPRK
jgi:hypothetical protein